MTIWRWANFSPKELACPCCGEQYIDERALDVLQSLREQIGPLKINSAHRCALHNARVGGAPLSMHKKLAFDIAIGGNSRGRLYSKAKSVGFVGFGFGQTFLHVDTRARPAHWFYGKISEGLWQGNMI